MVCNPRLLLVSGCYTALCINMWTPPTHMQQIQVRAKLYASRAFQARRAKLWAVVQHAMVQPGSNWAVMDRSEFAAAAVQQLRRPSRGQVPVRALATKAEKRGEAGQVQHTIDMSCSPLHV